MGKLVARSVVTDNITRHIHLSPDCSVAEVKVPARFAGQTLRQIDPRKAYGINVVAIKKRVPEITELGERTFKESTQNVPEPDVELAAEDILVVVGQDEQIEKFSRA
jgi:trk system potassium uptake protein TrkA